MRTCRVSQRVPLEKKVAILPPSVLNLPLLSQALHIFPKVSLLA